jgi:hypothetical protein
MPSFEGTSNKSDLQEALQKAVDKALSSTSHTDKMVSYTVKKIAGRKGGVAGFNELTVAIDVDAR